MQIDRLDLTAFGPFTDVSIDLSGVRSGAGLHLIYGPNEAGKSSALRAIQQFFRGFLEKSPDDFLHKYDAFRVGMRLRDRSGAVLELVRRKGRKNTLLNADGKAIDEGDERLRGLLGGVAAEDYLQRFVIDQQELKDGGKAILAGRGELGEALFSAATGLVRLGAVRKRLEDEAEALFKPRGKISPLNRDLAELESLRKTIRNVALKSTEWRALDESWRANEKAKAEQIAALQEAERARNRLIRFRDAQVPIAQRRAVLEELGPLADVPRLGEDFTKRRFDAEAALKTALRDAKATETAIADLTQRRDAIAESAAILAEEDAITAMYRALGACQRSANDRPMIALELTHAENDARAALRDLGRDPELLDDESALNGLQLLSSDRALVHELSGKRDSLIKARDDAEKAQKKHVRKRELADAKLATLAPERDSSALRKAIKRARDDGALEEQRDKARAALKRDERRAEKDLAALGLWSGTLDAVETLTVPSHETVERFRDEIDTILAKIASLQKQHDELEDEARALDARLDPLRIAADMPTEAALANARSRRETLWTEIKQFAGQGTSNVWETPIPAAFEAAIRQADEIADRLRREADRVAERATAEADQALAAKQMVDVDAKHEVEQARLRDERARWRELWSTIDITEPREPREMLVWLRKHASVSTQARSVSEQRDALHAMEEQIAAHRRAVSAALVATGENAADEGETLADLLDRAEDVVKTIAEEAAARKEVHKEQAGLDHDQPDLEEQAAAAQVACDRWEASWSAAMARIGRPADESPTLASAALEGIETLFQHVAATRRHRKALDRLLLEAKQFADDVRALATRVGFSTDPPFNPESVAADLYTQFDNARTDHRERESLAQQIQNQHAALREAEDAIALQRDRLETLRREARCDDLDKLYDIENQARRRDALETERVHLEGELHRLAGGASLEVFLDEAEQIDPDGLAPKIEDLGSQITALDQERQTLDQEIGSQRDNLKQLNSGDSRVAEIGQDAEDLRARIEANVDEYARLRLASAVLRAGIERYREKTRGPVLERAEWLFHALTLGSFRGLEIGYNDKDEPVLRGVRGAAEGPSASVDLAGMSEGTADQLYLALRLATLEAFLDRHEPLPLIVDDILIQFDDERTEATLNVLSRLAERTQVLVFTHHQHIQTLAERVLAPGSSASHRLPGRGKMPPPRPFSN